MFTIPPPGETDPEQQAEKLSTKKGISEYIKGSLNKLVVLMFIAIILVINGQPVPQEQVYAIYILVFMVFNGFTLYFIYSIASKRNKTTFDKVMQLETDQIVYNKKNKIDIERLTKQNLELERSLKGRINALERYTPYAIYELDLATGLVTHINEQFTAMLGWTLEDLNFQLGSIDYSQRAQKFVELIYDKIETVMDMLKMIESKLFDPEKPSNLKNVFLKHKNGSVFPATIRSNILQENNTIISQEFISDEKDVRSLIDTAKAQNDMINYLVDIFSSEIEEKTFIKDFMVQIEKELAINKLRSQGDTK